MQDAARQKMTPHPWRFFRAGGFDQVLLETGADLFALAELDQKLWVVLSCPVEGVEFDKRTLELIDTDRDGHIRAPEILAALEWLRPRLKEPELLISGAEGVPLAGIDEGNEAGAQLLNSAKTLLANIGKADAQLITVADTVDSIRIFGKNRFNGDGVIPPAAADDTALQQWLNDIVACMGGEPDRSGELGISLDTLTRFSADAAAWLAWQGEAEADPAIRLLGHAADMAGDRWQGIRGKIEDFFLRCRLALYDSRAATVMNSSDADLAALASRNLAEAGEEIAALPLAAVNTGQTLDLTQGVNPAWVKQLEEFRQQVVRPLLGDLAQLSLADWMELQERLVDYDLWWSRRVETPLSGLGLARLRQWSDDRVETALAALLQQDLDLKEAADAMEGVEKLVRFCRDLLPLVNNFVSFSDFYTGRGKAIFQAGTLYLDGRSCELCVKVNDIVKHALLASLSRVYLVYCDCLRNGGSERMTIAAAFTSGDSDQLLVGRNGIFYDRSGVDWDATVSRIIDHPISIRQAFWAPYKRIIRMVGEQLQKLAAARSRQAEEKAVSSIMQLGDKKVEGKQLPPPQHQQMFDVGKFAGIFAAIGLAVGAIGTAIASVISGFFRLAWWQMPLALAGVMLMISGPSLAIAWFKLHQRNLGPLLDANGWAVNARAKLNIPFGASLTAVSRLPEGTRQLLADPFAEKHAPWRLYLAILAGFLLLLAAWQLGWLNRICK